MASCTKVSIMDSANKENIGNVLRPVLTPFHAVDGCPLQNVWETSVDDELESIQLEFEPGFLNIDVDTEDDTLRLCVTRERRSNSRCTSHLSPWKQQIGKPFGWGWIGVNQQGYLDGVSLSFGSVTPQFSITAIASTLRLSKNQPVHTRALKQPVPHSSR